MKKLLLSIALSGFIAGAANANIIHTIAVQKEIAKCEVLTKDIASTTIPFTIEKGWVIIEVTVSNNNGKARKEKFILDTGAPTILTTDYTQEAGIVTESISVKEKTLLNAKKAADEKRVATSPTILQLGAMQVQQQHVYVDNINAGDIKCLDVKGLIGSNVLSKFTLKFDFVNNTLTLSNKDKFDYASIDTNSLELSFITGILQHTPTVFLKVNGKTILSQWDAGYNGAFLLQYKNDDKMSVIASDAATKTYETAGAIEDADGGSKKVTTMYAWTNASFTNENKDLFQVKDAWATTNDNMKSTSLTIGMEFMARYKTMIIDWKKDKIYLSGLKNDDAPVAKGNDLSVHYFNDSKKFSVIKINVKDPFYAKGLRAGDEVTGIDGKPIAGADINNCEINDKIGPLGRGARSITVKRNGQEVNIAL